MPTSYSTVTMSRTILTYLYRLPLITKQRETIMNKNVGSIDKVIRLVLGFGLAAWAVLGMGLGSIMSFIALAVGAILIATALMSFCPLFRILGISSRKKAEELSN